MYNFIRPRHPVRIFGGEPTTYANRKARLGLTSIADRPHNHARAIARRQRQIARDTTRNA